MKNKTCRLMQLFFYLDPQGMHRHQSSNYFYIKFTRIFVNEFNYSLILELAKQAGTRMFTVANLSLHYYIIINYSIIIAINYHYYFSNSRSSSSSSS